MATAHWGSIDLGGTVGVLQAAAALRVAWFHPTGGAHGDGDEPAGAGPRGTIVLAQGFGEFLELYAETIADLRARGYAVISFDWRGQGGSDRAIRGATHVRRFIDYGDDLVAVIQHAHEVGLPRPFHLVAHSMGGLVALDTAPRLASEVERMVLLAPLVRLHATPIPVPLARVAAAVLTGFGFGTVAVGKRVPRGPFSENRITTDQRRYETIVQLSRDNPDLVTGPPTAGWIGAMFAACARLNRYAHRPLEVPALILTSADDVIVSSDAATAFAKRTKGASAVVLPGARHQALYEREAIRQMVFAAIDAFCAEAERRLPARPATRRTRTLRFTIGSTDAPNAETRDAPSKGTLRQRLRTRLVTPQQAPSANASRSRGAASEDTAPSVRPGGAEAPTATAPTIRTPRRLRPTPGQGVVQRPQDAASAPARADVEAARADDAHRPDGAAYDRRADSGRIDAARANGDEADERPGDGARADDGAPDARSAANGHGAPGAVNGAAQGLNGAHASGGSDGKRRPRRLKVKLGRREPAGGNGATSRH